MDAVDLFNKAREPKALLTIENGPHGCFGTLPEFEGAFKSLMEEKAYVEK